ncbi:MAG: hypothetical protein H6807_14650 [Planctomycetes bacterium]|nr:hypothetical protein [Planctomycetota bacterium]
MRRFWPQLLMILALAVFVLARRQLDGARVAQGGLALADAPTSLHGVFLFGAFKPLLVEELWAACDRYEREGRYWDLVDAQARLLRLAPEEPAIWSRQARLLAFTVAQNEPDDLLRWRWYRRVLAIIDAGRARHPQDFALAELRFTVLFDLIAGDSYCSRQVRRGVEGAGLLAALTCAADLRRDFPERVEAWDDYRVAVEESAEFLMNRGRFRESRELLVELRGILFGSTWPFPQEPLRPGLESVLRFGEAAMTTLGSVADWRAEPPVLERPDELIDLLEGLAELIRVGGPALLDPDRETFDASLAMLIHVRAMNLCQAALLAKNHDLALRLLPPLNRIATLAEGRVGSGMPCYPTAYVEHLRALIALDAELDESSGQGEEVVSELRLRWRRELQELDRLVTERIGHDDSFARRLMNSRR